MPVGAASGARVRDEHEDPDGVSVLADILDPDGRRVVLDAAGWAHIVVEHAEMAVHREAVLATVSPPHHRGPDPRPLRERFWRRGLGPSR
jgi:hypothetical protein